MGNSMQERADLGIPTTPVQLPTGRDSKPSPRPGADVLELTLAERWHALERRWHEGDGRFHLSNIKAFAGIGSRNTHVSMDQIAELHRESGRIVEGLDMPASGGPTLAFLAGMASQSAADLAAAAAVDADALQRHFDGEASLSKIAYLRVIRAMVGTKAIAA